MSTVTVTDQIYAECEHTPPCLLADGTDTPCGASLDGEISTSEGMLASQRSFEAMFDHQPKVDLRTPRMVKAQAARENWK